MESSRNHDISIIISGLASFTGLLFEKVRSRIEAIAGDAEQLKVLLRSDYSESAYGQDGINIDMIKPGDVNY